MFGLTLDQGADLISLLLFIGCILACLLGWQQLSDARKLPFFLLRRERIGRAWRVLALGVGLGILFVFSRLYGKQIVYQAIPPTPSITPTWTITPTSTNTLPPTITKTPTISLTPTVSGTPTVTATPIIPEAITVLFQETITPRPEAAFSEIQVSQRLDRLNRAVEPGYTFINPIVTLYGAFTYDFLDDGVRWTSLWYREATIVCVESKPWDGGTGGYGYTECTPAEGWLQGNYEIQLFLGQVWQVSTRFEVTGSAVTLTPTYTPTHTITPSLTSTAE